MLDPEGEEWRQRIELRKADENQKGMRWFVLFLALANWCSWFLVISRHWGQMWNHVAAVALLLFFPMPCIAMFIKRWACPSFAAFQTYILLLLAFLVAVSRFN